MVRQRLGHARGRRPLLVVALLIARRGSVQALLSWLGLVGYAVYNYAYYLLGAALNAFFLLYVVAFVLSAVTLIVALSRLDVGPRCGQFSADDAGARHRRLSRLRGIRSGLRLGDDMGRIRVRRPADAC